MTNINKIVWDYIDHHIAIKKSFQDGLINVSSLARKIAKECHAEQHPDAIISAIRRYSGKTENLPYQKIRTILSHATFTSKTKLASVLVIRNQKTEEKSSSIHTKIVFTRDSTLLTIESNNFISIIVDMAHLSLVKELFLPNEIENVQKNLGKISILLDKEAVAVPGIFATILQEFALHNITLVDAVLCHLEDNIILHEKDLEKAFTMMLRLTKSPSLSESGDIKLNK